MWICEISSSSNYKLSDSYSQSTNTPPTDTQLNGSNDLKEVSFSNSNGVYTVTFVRALNTNDPFDYVIKLVNLF
jgi:hypothetical protein